MVVNSMNAALEILNEKSKLISEKFDKCYIRGNETIEFKENFLNKINDIEKLLNNIENEENLKIVSKLLIDVNNELETLEHLFNASSMFILPQVHSVCDELLWCFEERLTLLKKNHINNKKIKESEKYTINQNKSSIDNNNFDNNNNLQKTTIIHVQQNQKIINQLNQDQSNKIQNHLVKNITNKIQNKNRNQNFINKPTNVTPTPTSTTKFVRNIEGGQLKKLSNLNDKHYTLENLNGVTLELTEKIINSAQVLLTGLTNCCVKIGFHLDILEVFFCKNCRILVGHVTSSFINNTKHSVISVNGDRIRIEFCEETLFKIPIKSHTTVKESYNLEFAQYEIEFNKKLLTKGNNDIKDNQKIVTGQDNVEINNDLMLYTEYLEKDCQNNEQ